MHSVRFFINTLTGKDAMKTKKLIKNLYQAALSRDRKLQRELYKKLLDKSLKHKYTYAVD